jgi:hypothetical protein
MDIRGALAVGWLIGLVLGGGGVPAAGAGSDRERPAPAEPQRGGEREESRAARRRWALARMDEMAGERLRCRERFSVRRQVEACEADYVRRFREYNEVYLEASRD